jgi:asparagine synthase (glutamine-hydrolysing)
MFAAYFSKPAIHNLDSKPLVSAFHTAMRPIYDFGNVKNVCQNAAVVSFSDTSYYFENNSLRLIFFGRLDNRAELSDRFECSDKFDPCPAELIAHAWDTWGDKFVDRLIGDFAIVISSKLTDKVVMVRDAIGIRPLFYFSDSKCLICATTPKAILNAAPGRLKKNKKWIARFMVSAVNAADPEETAYEKLSKVRPGHIVVWEKGEITQNRRWKHWHACDIRTRRRDNIWVDRHRNQVFRAVGKHVSDGGIGIESSAGIDSSSIVATIAALSSEEQKKQLVCFGLADTPLTETLIHELSCEAGIEETVINRTDGLATGDCTEDDSAELQIMGFPLVHQNYVDGEVLRSHREDKDVGVVLSGFGGDEIVTSFANIYPKELIDQKNWRLLYDIQKGNFLAKILRSIRRVWEDSKAKKETYTFKFGPSYDASIFNLEAVEKYKIGESIRRELRVDGSLRTINSYIIEKELEDPNIATRMENHTVYGNAYGVEYRWPLLDEELVQNFLDTPSIEKYGPDQVQRYLHKRAMDDIVPDQINWRPSKHLGEHFEAEGKDAHDLDYLITDTQNALDNFHPDLAEFFRPEQIQEILDRLSRDRPRYEEFQDYEGMFYNFIRLNYWFHNGQ